MKVVIVANGNLTNPAQLKHFCKKTDLIIAVDGGANYCDQKDILPHYLVGDLDSVQAGTLEKYRQKDVTICQYPAEKDKTDLELALDLAIKNGATRIAIFAALGGRWDMSLANLLVLTSADYTTTEITLFDDTTIIKVVHAGQSMALTEPAGTTVSFIPIGGDATGVTLVGLKYRLKNSTLCHASSRGLSNVLQHSPATVTLHSGTLLAIISFGLDDV